MNVYQYIAQNNPDVARSVCTQFGLEFTNVSTVDDLAQCLETTVAQEGEPALRLIMEEHPDKDLILELFSGQSGQSKCKCSGEKKSASVDKYVAAAQGGNQTHQGNLFLIAATLILAVAIIVKK